jgi:hypothetical protein
MTTKRSSRFRITAILVVVLVSLVVLAVGCLVHTWHKSEQRLVHMLSETDYQAVLNACRQLSQRVAAGDLEAKPYRLRSPLPWVIPVTPAPEAASFPEAILDLDPSVVVVYPYGLVRVLLQVYPDQGLLAYPENYRGHDQAGNVELIPGLWFTDGNYRPDLRSEFTKHVEELIQRGKDYQRAIRGDTGSRPEGAH